ncbi:MAG: glycoside hydrolase family 2 TIM barrel-domain containing protein [Ruthenibacterium sp.]
MRIALPFNDWLYKESFDAKEIQNTSDEGFVPITVPHANKELPLNYFDEKSYQFVSCYKKHFHVPMEYAEKRVFIEFEGVANYAEVYLNGKPVGTHKGAYTAFQYEITELLAFNAENTFVVQVDSTERSDIPPLGYLIDYLCYGGIYREVTLTVTDDVFIERLQIKPMDVMEERKKTQITAFLNSTQAQKNLLVYARLLKDGAVVREEKATIDVPSGSSSVVIQMENLAHIARWSPDDPQLYEVEVQIADSILKDRFGFRKIEFTVNGLLINEQKIKFRGLNRHQSYPYVGYAMPKRAQRKDADILKNELCVDMARTSHYPQSRHFLDRCDEIGLLVFEELPGWQHIGDDAWKELSCENVKDMIEHDYNHPSIVIWGVRINESGNDAPFYEKTNKIAHTIDDTRPTGGVKYLENIDFQEDVFVMNDFQTGFENRQHRDQNISTGLKKDVPYMISEFVGIFHPTKRYDTEQHRVEQALRHAWGHDEIALDDRVCGAIAWCAFDYNTHFEFGPGDRICYHGVMDMFRLPKWAADFYASQQNPHIKPILAPATMWTNGDRQNGGFLPLHIFTNCDKVEFHFRNTLVATLFPSRHLFGGLKHAPIRVEKLKMEWDNWCWEDGIFIGYVDEKPVIEKRFAKNPYPAQLTAHADDDTLIAQKAEEPYDVTRVVFYELDQLGNTLDFMMDPIHFAISGPGSIIGPVDTVMQGGCIAVWVRTTGETGTICIQAKTSRFESNEVKIAVR